MHKISIHKFNSLDQISFDPKEYSRLKFGDLSIAEKYGKEMARFFFKNYHHIIVENDILLYESAFKHSKNAANLITNFFFNELNTLCLNTKIDFIQRSKIHRSIPYTADYGKLDLNQRKKLLAQDTFTFDDLYAKNKVLLFIDDVYISGAHHQKIEKMLNHYQMDHTKCFGLYYGEYQGNDGFSIESELNFSQIRNSEDLLMHTKKYPYEIVVRTMKMLFSDTMDDFDKFIDHQDVVYRENLLHNVLGEGYLSNPLYQKNIIRLAERLSIEFNGEKPASSK